ncbi:5-oxoprolinase subunit C family protein [Paraburkholderia caledonica]|uniref:Biotin-dependent carboxylase-like uncharacterized protein n=1 Tax=Paraburkholderia caledonica TaxID=134536 RepID=A0AB73IMJ9_9BURK|nr:biotin-dependent carboxylase-like uncharacterized protein [Paraburkholderia caledonica]
MIEVLQSGPLVSVQDLGRTAFRHIGVSNAGAMDRISLQIANMLVCNDPEVAGIELTGCALRLRITLDCCVAIAGADARPVLAGKTLPPFWAARVPAGAELQLNVPSKGIRTYLAVSGGVDVPSVLRSRSTDFKANFGGYMGRNLKAGDHVSVGQQSRVTEIPASGYGAYFPRFQEVLEGRIVLRVIVAGEFRNLIEESQQAFWETEWNVSPSINRMGLRLQGGAPLHLRQRTELLSHPIVPGVIQVPHDGLPIVQACDANTCGGYPKAGVVIEADMWKLGQLRPGDTIVFVPVDQQQALYEKAKLIETLEAIGRDGALVRHWETAAC